MKKVHIRKKYKLISLLLIIFLLIGCDKNSQKPSLENKQNNNPSKLPEILSELEEDVLIIMYDLDSVTALKQAIDRQENIKAEQEINSVSSSEKSNNSNEREPKESQSSEDEGSSSEENIQKLEEEIDLKGLLKETEIIIPLLDTHKVSGSFTENGTPPNNITKVWNQITDNITEVHRKWNILESNLTLVNVPNVKTEEFENILNNLTLSIMNKEQLNSLMLANELTRITTDFRSYYNQLSNHSVYNMYYHIRGSILSAASDNYTTAIDHLNEANNSGSALKEDLINNDSQNILRKFELSIEDLRKSLENENFILSQIKAPIVIKNIKLIEDELKTQKN